MRQYFSRRDRSRGIPEIPVDAESWVGIYSGWALLWGCLFLLIPVCYVYIALTLLRELCFAFPDSLYASIQTHLPSLANIVNALEQHSSRAVEFWCWIEGIFYIGCKWHVRWLQTRDPLEASLSAAPMMDLSERQELWNFMMESERDIVGFLRGWFFDQPLENISKYDVRDFAAWSLFETRHQEHLSTSELEQLEAFVDEIQVRISLELYGEDSDEDSVSVQLDFERRDDMEIWQHNLPRPTNQFEFSEESNIEEPNFFSNLYETYRTRYDQMVRTGENMVPTFHTVQEIRNLVANADFHPVQDLRNMVGNTAQRFAEAEEHAKATGRQVYETLVPTGSSIDKQLSAMSRATYTQLTEAWNSVKNISERLETARFLSKQRQRLRQQLKGYRVMLNRMLEKSSAVPSKQMASLMRQITECNQAMEHLESRAQNAFVQATGFAQRTLPSFLQRKEPQHFAKYSSDPLLGIATYPLGFHLLILGGTEIPLRILMAKRGFTRNVCGAVSYYFHPGSSTDDDDELGEKMPIAFVHGIGIGLIAYMPLIDRLLATGRPIILPEIPYVSAFRPWQSPNAVLQPAVVTSTMTAILATHGFMLATWVGHSYGTSWLSYMCKYAPNAVAALLFLDPVCFCLHLPRLTKSFVYTRADPGTISYLVRTDIMTNWTVQRSFPWAWIDLFVEHIEVPCSIYLSERDALVPSNKIAEYLRSKDIPIREFQGHAPDDFDGASINCTVFLGVGHGDWTENTVLTVPDIANSVEVLCRRAELLHEKSQ